MNRSETEDGRHEIVIVRRGGHDDDHEHHGGVWKIAFADFMTAMMCFFLVMWLINATNEETRTALASYFNPIKLVDERATRKGLDDNNADAQTSTDDSEAEPAEQEAEPVAMPKATDQNLFDDPYAVLAEIAADTGQLQNISAKGDGGVQDSGPGTGASGGESYRDPFAPDFWSTQIETPVAAETAQKSVPEGQVAEVLVEDQERFAQTKEDPFAPAGPVAEEQPLDEDKLAELLDVPAPAETERQSETAEIATDEPVEKAEETPPPPSESPAATEIAEATNELAEQIRTELAAAFGGTAKLDGITVEQSEAGVMISVADDMQDGMFEIGSAVPRRDLVLAMEKIGKTLASHQGAIVINGHTDGRPFSRGDYDNWRLSTARAHATYYMLVRGGLAEERITGVAGYADRKLKRADDPFASVNRRIEILLGAPG